MDKKKFYNLLRCRYNYICELRDVSDRLYEAFSRGDLYSSALILESRADVFVKLDELMQNIKLNAFPSILDIDKVEMAIRADDNDMNDKIVEILKKSHDILEILKKKDELISIRGMKRNLYNGR